MNREPNENDIGLLNLILRKVKFNEGETIDDKTMDEIKKMIMQEVDKNDN